MGTNTDKPKKVYLDNMANTPPDPRVIDEMIPHLKNDFGNPLNIHSFGQQTQQAIEDSRQKVAEMVNAQPKEIIFTSCGTESNNFAVKGLARANQKRGNHLISSSIEHFSILYPLKELEKEGFDVTYLPVDKNGIIDPSSLKNAITDKTILVTLTHASNEIGTLEPINEIGMITREKGILFHVDGMQTAGTIPVDVKALNIDALSLAANLFYGPTGAAALYLKQGTRILPFLLGGTQEEGKRAGTNNISGIVGMGKAAELARLEMGERNKKLVAMRDRLIKELPRVIDDFFITGHPSNRLPGHVSGCVKFVEGESMSMFLDMEGVAVSTGSACVSKALKASHVLLAIGVSPEVVHGSLVFSFGKDNEEADVDYVLEKLPPIVERLRKLSPLKKDK
ncbi:MAG: cysteine desulfurase [Candidatus Margulisbacteria bacterium]|nr:cysteine desulfurase [Candidatus Margulisiibacteriota bacterium]